MDGGGGGRMKDDHQMEVNVSSTNALKNIPAHTINFNLIQLRPAESKQAFSECISLYQFTNPVDLTNSTV